MLVLVIGLISFREEDMVRRTKGVESSLVMLVVMHCEVSLVPTIFIIKQISTELLVLRVERKVLLNYPDFDSSGVGSLPKIPTIVPVHDLVVRQRKEDY